MYYRIGRRYFVAGWVVSINQSLQCLRTWDLASMSAPRSRRISTAFRRPSWAVNMRAVAPLYHRHTETELNTDDTWYPNITTYDIKIRAVGSSAYIGPGLDVGSSLGQ